MKQLGGVELIPIGLADDQHTLGVDGAVDPWMKTLWAGMLARHPLEPGQIVVPPTSLAPPKYKVVEIATMATDFDESTSSTGAAGGAAAGGGVAAAAAMTVELGEGVTSTMAVADSVPAAAEAVSTDDKGVKSVGASADAGVGAGAAVNLPPPSKQHPYHSTLLVNTRMTSPGHFQDVR